eukprot:9697281-Heterocapsa_arctica.AAC.1
MNYSSYMIKYWPKEGLAMIKATPKWGLQMARKRKHGEGEWKAPDHGIQKGGGKGGKGGGKEPYKQWANPGAARMGWLLADAAAGRKPPDRL